VIDMVRNGSCLGLKFNSGFSLRGSGGHVLSIGVVLLLVVALLPVFTLSTLAVGDVLYCQRISYEQTFLTKRLTMII
jgi:hypothetical protein